MQAQELVGAEGRDEHRQHRLRPRGAVGAPEESREWFRRLRQLAHEEGVWHENDPAWSPDGSALLAARVDEKRLTVRSEIEPSIRLPAPIETFGPTVDFESVTSSSTYTGSITVTPARISSMVKVGRDGSPGRQR